MTPSIPLAAAFLAGATLIFAIEIFVPSAGLLFLMGAMCMIASVIVGFMVSPGTGLVFLGLDLGVGLALFAVMLNFWIKTPIARRMKLEAAPAPAEPEPSPLSRLLGRFGKSATPLRPAGICLIDGQRIDVVSDGPVLDAGETVKVVRVDGLRIVVRKADDERFRLDEFEL